MSFKVLVTPRSFGLHSSTPMDMLNEPGIEIFMNPYGRIMTESEMIHHIKEVDAVIVGIDPLSRDVLKEAHNLKIIAKYGVGTDNIDVGYAKERGIEVTISDGSNTDAVADYTFALMLAVARKVTTIDQQCRIGNWQKMTTIDVSNRTLGLIGLGKIGKAVVRRASGFGMKILAYDLAVDHEFAREAHIQYMGSLDELLKQADFISLHLPLNEHTKKIIGFSEFNIMKSDAVLINTARGGLIDEEALYQALKNNRIWGAGIDVFEREPPDNPELLTLENMIMGSHCAASTVQAIDNMGNLAARHVIDYFKRVNRTNQQ